MQTKLQPHHYVGWALIGGSVLLFLLGLIEVIIAQNEKALSLIPFSILLCGLLVLPGIMILKKKWGDLSSVLSGCICIALFGLLCRPVYHLLDGMVKGDEQRNLLLASGQLLVWLSLYFLASRLHRWLEPKFRALLASKI